MATIHDVARAAGVSIATVSRSLNGQSRVSEETRRRVLDVARSLDFTPNRAARGLVTGRLGNVGVLVPDIANPFYGPIVAGIEEVVQQQDLGVLIADSREEVEAEVGLTRRLAQHVDGIILVGSRVPDDALLDLAGRVPTVLVNRVLAGLPAVAIDARRGMAELLTEVAGLGHSRVTYLDGPVRSWSGREKLAGLREAAPRLGVELQVLGPYAPSYAAGRALAEEVLAAGAEAVIAYDDLIAWGLLTRLQELGVRVPEDVSVAGFDDALEDGMVRPTLTTVSPQGASVGSLAAEMLLGLLTGTATPRVELLPCRVVVRDSTAPPRSGGGAQ